MAIRIFGTAALMAALLLAGHSAGAQESSTPGKSGEKKFSAGLSFSDKAKAEDTGMPLYPGATPHRDEKHDVDGVNLGFWGGSFGLKIVVVKLETEDSVESVAAFYQPALAEFGDVLDCGRSPREPRTGEAKRKLLTCENDRPHRNGQLYKSGTRDRQHIVSIRPRAKGSTFELIYIEKKGTD